MITPVRCCAISFTTLAIVAAVPSPMPAASLSALDDFQSGTTSGWGGGAGVSNAADSGPQGAGDHALRVAPTSGRVAIVNAAQWTGNFTAAGITQLLLDVRNENAFPLEMRIGFAQGTVASGGAGDTYVSAASVPVANDGQWHRIALSLSPEAFVPHTANSNPTPDAATALSNVSHFRILHNTIANFLGATGPATFYLDNIRAVPEPAVMALQAPLVVLFVLRRRCRGRL